MSDICPTCGLPSDLCMCETIAREGQKITIEVVKRRFGKKMTVIYGIGKDVNIKDVTKKLKTAFACGGTAKNGVIELQGTHVERIKEELIKQGFAVDAITIKKPKFKGKVR